MASPSCSQQASTPANSKRKASANPLDSPARRPMPAWNTKLDALSHLVEGALAGDKRNTFSKEATESFLAANQDNATRLRKVNEPKSNNGASRDALMAKLQLLSDAHQKLTGSSKDLPVRYAKQKLALEDILAMFKDLNKLWQSTAEKPTAEVEKWNAILVERDELYKKERDHSTELVEAAERDRDKARKEKDTYIKQLSAMQEERDELLQERDLSLEQVKAAKHDRNKAREEKDTYRKDVKAIREKRDALFRDRDEYRDRVGMLEKENHTLQEEKERAERCRSRERQDATKKSMEVEKAQQELMGSVERKRDEYFALKTRYRQEREEARESCDSLRRENNQYQIRLEKIDKELSEAKKHIGTYKNPNIQLFFRLTNVLASHDKTIGLRLRRLTTQLQGDHQSQLNGERRVLENKHSTFVRDLKQGWEQEKAQIEASATELRRAMNHIKLAAKETKERHSAALETYQLNLRRSRDVIDEKDETAHSLVIAVAVLLSSHNSMRTGFLRRGRVISNGIDRIQELEEQLTGLQGTIHHSGVAIATLGTAYNAMRAGFLMRGGTIDNGNHRIQDLEKELTELQEANATSITQSMELRDLVKEQEEKLGSLSTSNEATILTLQDVQSAHANCENDRRLQLGHINRRIFFDTFSEFAQSLPEKGCVFSGEENGQHVDVCFCIPPGSNEALCVIQRCDNAFTVWHSKLEDCSTFAHAWQRWLCLGGEHQGKPIYMSVKNVGDSEVWLRKVLPVRTLCSEEVAKFAQFRELQTTLQSRIQALDEDRRSLEAAKKQFTSDKDKKLQAVLHSHRRASDEGRRSLITENASAEDLVQQVARLKMNLVEKDAEISRLHAEASNGSGSQSSGETSSESFLDCTNDQRSQNAHQQRPGPSNAPRINGESCARKRKANEISGNDLTPPVRAGSEVEEAEASPSRQHQRRGTNHVHSAPTNGRSYVLGAFWKVSDVRHANFRADPVPKEVLDTLRRQIRQWDDKLPSWEDKIFYDGGYKCSDRLARQKGTDWVKGDQYACKNCTTAKAVCVGLNNREIKILPVYREADREIASLGPEDVRYWVLE